MDIYSIKSLREIINDLRALPAGSKVAGFESSNLHSDRGYYERSAITPGEGVFDAHQFADELEQEIGLPTEGWKGGDYSVKDYLPVAYAEQGDTGPYLAGFVEGENEIYVSVGVNDW